MKIKHSGSSTSFPKGKLFLSALCGALLGLPGLVVGADGIDGKAVLLPVAAESLFPSLSHSEVIPVTGGFPGMSAAIAGITPAKLPSLPQGDTGATFAGGLYDAFKRRGESMLTPHGAADTLRGVESGGIAGLGGSLAQSAIDGGLSQVEDKLLGNFVRSINLSFSPSLAGRETILQADSILSLYDSDEHALIGQAGLQSRGGDAAGNLGLAWRYRAVDNWMLGVNTFYDYLADPQVDRWSFGVEARSHFVGVSANIYRGISEERNGTIEHYSPDGWDMELAGHLEQLPWLEYSVRYYKWNLLDGGDLNGSDYKLTVRPMPLLGLGLRYDSPGGGDSEFGFETTFEYRFDLPFEQQKLFGNVATVGDVWQRRFERVRREYEQRVQTRSLGPSGRQLGRCFGASCSISFRNVPSGTGNLLLTANRRTGGAGLVRAVAPTGGSPSGSGGVARNHSGNCHVEGVAAAACSYDGTSQTATIMNMPAGSYSLAIDFRNSANDVLGSATVQLEVTLPTLSINGSTTVTEANDFSLSFISDGPLASAITISMSVSGGTAEPGDYVLPAAAIALPVVAGASNVPFTIEVNEDTDLDNETIELTFTLSGDAMGVAAPAPITLSITDDDSAMLSSLAVSSGALVPAFAPDTTSYTLMVASDVRSVSLTPTAADTDAMGITINGSSVVSGSASGSITLPAGMTTQIQIVLTAEDGSTMLTYTIQAMAAAGPVLSVAASGGSVAEGGSVTLTISSMGGAPSEAVTIDIAAQAGSTASDSASGSIPADYSISASQVTLGADGTITPSSITIATVDDMVDEGAGETIMLAYSLTAGDSGASLATAAATITIQDNDAAGITVPGNVDVSLGNSTPFNVVLNSQPLFAVTLNMASAAPATATVSPASLSFTSANWNVPQAVTVNGVAGGTTNIAFTISTDAQSRYSSTVGVVAAPSVAVAVIAPPIITVTPTPGDSVTEGSAFTVQLAVSRAPGEQITMDVTVNTASTAVVNSDYLAFTGRVTIGSDGSVSPPSIAISTLNDINVEVRETIVLSYTVNAGGTGIVAPTDTTLYIDDDDSATLRVRSAPLTFNEAVGAATVTIELTGAFLASALQVMVSSADGTAAAGSDYTALSQMVTFAIGETSQMVSLTIEDDNVAEDDETLQLILVPATMPMGLNTVISPAMVTITDNDMRGVVSTGSGGFTVTEEASNTYTLALSSQPTGPVSIALTSMDTGAATVSPTPLSFSTVNWNVAQTVTVAGVPDDDNTNESTTITYVVSGSDYGSVTLAPQPVAVNDNDGPPLPTASVSVDSAAIAEDGATATVTVTLSPMQSSPVTVNLTRSGNATIDTDYTVASLVGSNPNYMLTVPANAASATFRLMASADTENDDAETAVFTVMAGPGYTPATDTTAAVTVTIMDVPPPLRVTPTASLAVDNAAIAENGGTATVTVTLDPAPTSAVTVTLTRSGMATIGRDNDYSQFGLTAGTGSAYSIMVAPSTTTATFTLTAIDDAENDDAETAVFTVMAGSGYIIGTPAAVTVTITDDDEPQPVRGTPTVSVSVDSAAIAENGGTATVTVTLSEMQSSAVTVNLTRSGDATITSLFAATDYSQSGLTAATGSAYSIMIPANTATATFTLTAVDDSVDEVDETAVFTVVTGGSDYTPATDTTAAVTVTITDDDMRGIVSTGSSGFMVQEEGSNTYTLALRSQPTDPVTIALTSTDTGVATVSPATLSFSTGDWSTAQTVTVAGVDDGDSTNGSTTITHAVSGGDYGSSAVTLAPQPVAVNDNDIGGITTVAGAGQVVLSWTNPTNSNLGSVVVMASANGAAVDINGAEAGTDITIGSAMSGASVMRTISGLAATEHSFTIVAMNASATSRLASGTATATPTAVSVTTPVVTVTPSVSSVMEGSGDGNGGVVMLTFALMNPRTGDVMVSVARNNSSTAAASDYSLPVSTVTLNSTTTSMVISLTTNPDTVYEGNESLVLSYTVAGAGAAGIVPPGDTTLTITEDDSPPEFSFQTATATVAEGASEVEVSIMYTGGPLSTIVGISLGGSAEPNDYTLSSINTIIDATTLTFDRSETSPGMFGIRAMADGDGTEGNQTLIITLLPGDGYTVGSANTYTLTITDVPPVASIYIGNAGMQAGSIAEADTTTSTTVTVRLSPAPSSAVTVNLTRSGNATIGTDYTAGGISGGGSAFRIIVAAGATTASFTLTAVQDTENDAAETATFTVVAGTGYTPATDTTAAVTVTITDDADPPGPVTVLAATPDNAQVALSWINPSDTDLSTVIISAMITGGAVVDINGAGTAGNDLSISATPGSMGSQTITGLVNGTGYTFSLVASDGTNSSTPVTTTATPVAPLLEFSFPTATATVAEGGGFVSVSIAFTGDPIASNTILNVSLGGTAGAADYRAGNGSASTEFTRANPFIRIAGGRASPSSFLIHPATDADGSEGNETLIITLLASTNNTYTLGATTTYTLTITDVPPPPPTASVSVNTMAIAEAGGTATVTVTLSSMQSSAVTVNLTRTGNADIGTGNDYTAATLGGANPNYTLTVLANMAAATFTLTALDDNVDDDNETATFTVVAGTGYTIGTPAAVTVTITDNDDPPDTTPPGPVTVLAATPGNAQVALSWTNPSDTDLSTVIISATVTAGGAVVDLNGAGTAGNDLSISATPGSMGSQSITGLVNGTGYTFSLVASDGTNSSTPVTTTATPVAPPEFSFQSATATVAEGSRATVNIEFTGGALASEIVLRVRLGGNFAATDYSIASGFARPDFAGGEQFIRIATGITSTASFGINTNMDAMPEATETLIITLLPSTDSTYTLGTNNFYTLTITNVPLPPPVASIYIGNAGMQAGSIAEAGTTSTTVTVSLSAAAPTGGVTVNLMRSGNADIGTGNDYTAASLGGANPNYTLTVPANMAAATFTLTALDDSADDDNEAAVFTVTPGMGYTIAAGGAAAVTVTITDNDDPPDTTPVVTVTPSVSSVMEGSGVGNGGVVMLTFALMNPQTGDVMVSVARNTGSTAAASDYSLPVSTVTLNSTTTSMAISLTTNPDTVYEGDESIVLSYTVAGAGAAGIVPPGDTTLTITEDDSPPEFSFQTATATVAEGAPEVEVSIMYTGGPLSTIVGISLGGSAVPNDYSLSSINTIIDATTLTFDRSETSPGMFGITATADGDGTEGNQTLIITLLPGDGYTVGSANTYTLTITDVPPTASVSVDTTAIAEDGATATVTVTLSQMQSSAVTVNLTRTGNASIGTGNDYTAASLGGANPNYTLTVPANMAAATFTLTALDDNVDEVDETATFTVVAGTGYTIGAPAAVTVTITDDDAPAPATPTASVSVNNAAIAEAGGTATATVTVTLTPAPTSPVTVNLTRSGNADIGAGNDYTAGGISGGGSAFRIIVAAGATTATFTLTAVDDNVDDDAETATFTVVAGTGYTIGAPAAVTVTITDNDMRGIVSTGSSGFMVLEEGSNTYTLALRSQPTGPVSIVLASTDTGAATVSPGTLNFSTGNWSTAQTVTVAGVPDGDSTNESTTITHAVSGSDYASAVTLAPQPVLVNDNDIGGITAVAGAGQVVLTWTNPTNSNLGSVVVMASANGAAVDINGDAAGTDITIGSAMSGVSVIRTISGLAGTEHSFTIVAMNPSATSRLASGTATATPTAVPPPVVTVTPSVNSVMEGSGAGNGGVVTLTFALMNPRPGDVTVTVARNSGSTAIAGIAGDYSLPVSTVTLNSTTTSMAISLTTNPDTVFEGDEVLILSYTVAGAGAAGIIAPLGDTALVINDDDAGTQMGVIPTAGWMAIEAAITEADTTTTTVTVRLNLRVAEIIRVNLRRGGLATIGTDYTTGSSLSGSGTAYSIMIPANAADASFTLTALNDSIYDGDETATFTIIPGTGYRVPTVAGQRTVTVSITDNEDPPAIPMASVYIDNAGMQTQTGTIAEAGITSRTVTVMLSPAPSSGVTVNLTSRGSATIATDYSQSRLTAGGATAYSIVVPGNTGIATFMLTALDDSVDDDDETATFTVTTGTGYRPATGGAATVTVTITDNDMRGIVSTGTSGFMVAEGDSNTYTLALRSQPTGPVSIAMGRGTGITVSPRMLNFSTVNWNVAQTVTVAGVEDADSRNGSTTITHAVSGSDYGSSAVTLAPQTVLVNDNDIGGISLAPVSDQFVLSWTNPTNSNLASVVVSATTTTNGAPVDINGDEAGRDITIGSAMSGAAVMRTISGLGAAVMHTFTIVARNSSAITLASGTATATPTAAPTPMVTVTPSGSSVMEGSGADNGNVVTLTFVLMNPRPGDVTVTVARNNSSTAAADDYSLPVSTVTLNSTAISMAISLTTTPDTVYEGDESLVLSYTVAGVGSIGSVGINGPDDTDLTIMEDDPPPEASIYIGTADTQTGTIAEAGTTSTTVTVSLSAAAPAGGVTVNLTRSGNATIGTDYTASSSSLSVRGTAYMLAVPPNATTATFILTAVDDRLDEVDETAVFTVTAGSGYTIGTTPAVTVTITDDDVPLDPVTGLRVSLNGNQAVLSWTNPTFAGTATVRITTTTGAGTSSESDPITIMSGQAGSHTTTDLGGGIRYTFSIVVLSSLNVASASATVSVTTPTPVLRFGFRDTTLSVTESTSLFKAESVFIENSSGANPAQNITLNITFDGSTADLGSTNDYSISQNVPTFTTTSNIRIIGTENGGSTSYPLAAFGLRAREDNSADNGETVIITLLPSTSGLYTVDESRNTLTVTIMDAP